jgi:hypothetical protein
VRSPSFKIELKELFMPWSIVAAIGEGLLADAAITAASDLAATALTDMFIGGVADAAIGGLADAAIGGFADAAIGGFADAAIGGFADAAIGGVADAAVGGFADAAIGGFADAAIEGAADVAIGGAADAAVGGAADAAVSGAASGFADSAEFSALDAGAVANSASSPLSPGLIKAGTGLLSSGINTGLNAITGTSGKKNTAAAVNAADPFSSQRSQYQTQLSNMMTPGSNFQAQDPSYNFRMQQGTAAVNAGAASSGLLNSGNRLTALQNYGQNTASTEFQNQYARLAQLSGANTGSTATAGGIVANAGATTSANNTAAANSLAGIAGSYFSTPSETPSPAASGFGSMPGLF